MVHILSYTAKATSGRANKRKFGKQQNCAINGTIKEMRKKMNIIATSGSEDAPVQQRQILRQGQERMTTGSMQQKANVFGNGSGRKQIQRATNNVTNDETKERWQRVNPATSGSGEAPLQQRQAQANSKIGNSKKGKPANDKNVAKQIQQATNLAVSENEDTEMRQTTNPTDSENNKGPLQEKQMQAKLATASSKKANSANGKNEETQIRQAANVEISKNKKRKMQQKARSAISASMKRQLRQQQQRQAKSKCNNATKRRLHIKCSKQKMNAKTGGGKEGQYPRTKNFKMSRNKGKRMQQKQMVRHCDNQQKKEESKAERQVNSGEKAGNMQVRHSAAISSKQMTYQATVSAKRRSQSAKAIKQIKTSTTVSTVQIRQDARSSTSPDGKAQKRYYHPIIELRVALYMCNFID